MKILLVLSLLTLCTLTPQDSPARAPKLAQHQWLHQLVGEWSCTGSAMATPTAAPNTWESKETVRSLGGLWIVAESTAETGVEPFVSLMTLGYDPSKRSYVGSWVDTMQTTMWSYVGRLDGSQTILTLEAEGPGMTDPNIMAKYRDEIELISADEKRTTSSIQEEDGTWTTYMTVEARRVKQER